MNIKNSKNTTLYQVIYVGKTTIFGGILLCALLWLSACGTGGTTSGDTTDDNAADATFAVSGIDLSSTGEAVVDANTATPSPLVTLASTNTMDENDWQQRPPTVYTYNIIATYPHDPNAFTQGLLFDGDILYEGTGLYGESTLRRVDLSTGKVMQQITLTQPYFGEGIALIEDRIYQLTWREQTGFIYDKETFRQIGEFTYPTEGWGLTYDGTHLIMSDGSNRLFMIDPATMEIVDEVTVSYFDASDGIRKDIVRINELEYIHGEIFANIWQTNFIVRITPETGNVTGIIDLTGILPEAERTTGTDVLNGIAYRSDTDQLYITGKKWPKLYEIVLQEE